MVAGVQSLAPAQLTTPETRMHVNASQKMSTSFAMIGDTTGESMTARSTLPNPPLVEALFELRWNLAPRKDGPPTDPYYRFLLGRLQEKVAQNYPHVEALPSSQIPDELVPGQATYRFRVAPEEWPLIQIGPGLITFNQTTGYEWPEFRRGVLSTIRELFEAHPKPSELSVQTMLLRYINADPIDKDGYLEFVRDQLGVSIHFPPELFGTTGVSSVPAAAHWMTQFPTSSPEGTINLTLGLGEKDQAPAVIWDLALHSQQAGIPRLPEDASAWLDSAHRVLEHWFFKLIEGSSLEHKYSTAATA